MYVWSTICLREHVAQIIIEFSAEGGGGSTLCPIKLNFVLSYSYDLIIWRKFWNVFKEECVGWKSHFSITDLPFHGWIGYYHVEHPCIFNDKMWIMCVSFMYVNSLELRLQSAICFTSDSHLSRTSRLFKNVTIPFFLLFVFKLFSLYFFPYFCSLLSCKKSLKSSSGVGWCGTLFNFFSLCIWSWRGEFILKS